MRRIGPMTVGLVVGLGVVTCGVAMARGAYPNMARPSPALHSGTMPPAVADPGNANKTLDAPVAGKNSFTQNEARKRLEHHGYANVTGLTKDDSSIWHADAVKDGKPVAVTVDYQGNITEGKVTQMREHMQGQTQGPMPGRMPGRMNRQ